MPPTPAPMPKDKTNTRYGQASLPAAAPIPTGGIQHRDAGLPID
jgi:hypothetical protein